VAERRLSADDRYSDAASALYVTFTHACFALFSLEKIFFLIPSLGFTGWTSLMPLARGYGSYWQGRGEIKAFQALIQSAVQALVWCQNSCIPGMLAVMGVGRKSSSKVEGFPMKVRLHVAGMAPLLRTRRGPTLLGPIRNPPLTPELASTTPENPQTLDICINTMDWIHLLSRQRLYSHWLRFFPCAKTVDWG
jgi:hypothetical protein